MKRIISLFLISLATIFFTAQSCFALNLLKNSSFEDGDFPPNDWADWSGSELENPNDGVAGFPTPEGVSHTGRRAVGKILYGSGSRWGGFSQTVDVTGGRMFNASGWVMTRSTDVALGRGAKAFIEVKFLDESENEIRKVRSAGVTRPSNWTRLTVRGLIPGKAKKAIFNFVLIGPRGSTGKVFFDDAALDISD